MHLFSQKTFMENSLCPQAPSLVSPEINAILIFYQEIAMRMIV